MVKKYTLLPRINPNSRDRVKCLKCDEIKEHHAKGMCFDCYRKHAWIRKKIVCTNCKRERYHKAFGLCGGCHTRLHHYEKTLRYNAKKYHDIDYELSKEITKECSSCGFSKVVQLHHLDGNTKNNERENIVGLCPNCHRLIHMYDFYEEIRDILKTKGFNVDKVHPTNYVKR